jgi:hypothetical protein
MHLTFVDVSDRVNRKQEMAIPEPEEAARANFEHPDFPLVLVDEEIAYVTDIFTVSIDHFAVADVLVRVCKDKTRIVQLFKFRIRRRLAIHGVPIVQR